MDKELKSITVDHMKKAIDHLGHELSTIRTGRASAALLDGIKVDYYGVPTPLKQVATVSVPDAKTILVQPFQQNMLSAVD
jgi:ribosome recycling factor